MEAYAAYYGEWSDHFGDYRWQRLDSAMPAFRPMGRFSPLLAGDGTPPIGQGLEKRLSGLLGMFWPCLCRGPGPVRRVVWSPEIGASQKWRRVYLE